MIDDVRGRDVYIIQGTCPPVDDHLIELFMLISAARRSSCRRIIAVIPYYGYSRVIKKTTPDAQVPLAGADIALMVNLSLKIYLFLA